MADRIAVLDAGKTNLKLSVTDAKGRVLESLSTLNDTRPGPPWRHHDLKGLGDWVLATLSDLCRRHAIGHLVPTGHGSGGVLVTDDPDAGGDGAALPMIDYEQPLSPTINTAYSRLSGGFFDRGSAVMMASTHGARQLLWMETDRPAEVAQARWYLNVAQYWAWRLSGVAVSEVTAMGAQSHFWNVPERRWSRIVTARGWTRLMPPFVPAWAALGPIRPVLCRRYGLPPGIVVHTGVHDSSASFYRYQAGGLARFTTVSTGTWIVALSDAADLARLDEARGMTINADVHGNPVGGALTMGGREFPAIAGEDWRAARADVAGIARLVAQGTFSLPSFGQNDGQFPGSAGRGRIIGPPPTTSGERLGLAILHSALLTAECADALAPGLRLILDGTFVQQPLYAPLVAALRPGAVTEVSAETAGVAAGAALLVDHDSRTEPVRLALTPALPLPGLPDLAPYAARWRALAKGASP